MSGETKGVTSPLKAHDWTSHTWEETDDGRPNMKVMVAQPSNLLFSLPFLACGQTVK